MCWTTSTAQSFYWSFKGFWTVPLICQVVHVLRPPHKCKKALRATMKVGQGRKKVNFQVFIKFSLWKFSKRYGKLILKNMDAKCQKLQPILDNFLWKNNIPKAFDSSFCGGRSHGLKPVARPKRWARCRPCRRAEWQNPSRGDAERGTEQIWRIWGFVSIFISIFIFLKGNMSYKLMLKFIHMNSQFIAIFLSNSKILWSFFVGVDGTDWRGFDCFWFCSYHRCFCVESNVVSSLWGVRRRSRVISAQKS